MEIPDHEYALEKPGCYVECPQCKTLFQQPMPDGTELASFYPSDYHSVTHTGLLQRIRNDVRIRKVTRLARDKGAILDFGCGAGDLLVQAAETQRRAGQNGTAQREWWGFEIADRPQTEKLADGAVTIVKGDLEDLLRELPPCAVITMNHVIEHLPDPGATVSALAKRLAPGGVLEGQTPAADSLEHVVFGRKWSGFHSPRHTVVFSRMGLTRLIEKCGLDEVRVTGAFNPAGVAVSLGSLADAGAGRIRRSGWRWMGLLAGASALAPVDLLSGRPGIVNFVAVKNSSTA
jgi:SAM-dependent methyltransferase